MFLTSVGTQDCGNLGRGRCQGKPGACLKIWGFFHCCHSIWRVWRGLGIGRGLGQVAWWRHHWWRHQRRGMRNWKIPLHKPASTGLLVPWAWPQKSKMASNGFNLLTETKHREVRKKLPCTRKHRRISYPAPRNLGAGSLFIRLLLLSISRCQNWGKFFGWKHRQISYPATRPPVRRG